jgi:hypothetical protein
MGFACFARNGVVAFCRVMDNIIYVFMPNRVTKEILTLDFSMLHCKLQNKQKKVKNNGVKNSKVKSNNAIFIYIFACFRFIQNNPTSLERNYKYEVLAEHDLGVTIDLINSDTYANDPNAVLSPFDEKLLEEDILTPQDTRRCVIFVFFS